MNLHRSIARLNRALGDKFGYIDGPTGLSSRYAWKHTAELYYMLDEGFEPAVEGGLILPRRRYTRHTWAERVGSVWVVAEWRPPQYTQAQWLEMLQDQFPYPANGRYLPIDGTQLNPGDEPDEHITDYVIGRIAAQKAATFAQLHQQSVDGAMKERTDRTAQWEAEFDNWWPAYDKVDPGSHGEHVEFQAGVGESRRFGGNDGSDH